MAEGKVSLWAAALAKRERSYRFLYNFIHSTIVNYRDRHCWCGVWSRSCSNSNCRANPRTDWQVGSASRSGDDSKCSAARFRGTLATLFGIVTLLLGASGIFGQLQEALNTWNVQPQPGLNIKDFLQKRLLSFAMVLVIGFLLIVSLVSAVLAAIANFFGHLFPGWIQLGQILNFIFSLSGTTV